jgi:hypothetical protein
MEIPFRFVRIPPLSKQRPNHLPVRFRRLLARAKLGCGGTRRHRSSTIVSVVILNSGTTEAPNNPRLSILTDLIIPLVELDPVLFPGVPSSVLVHEGFRDEHARTALPILAEVQNLLAKHGTHNLTLVSVYQIIPTWHDQYLHRSVTP